MTTIENYFKNTIKIPFCAPLAMQNSAFTANLAQMYATAEAFRHAISAAAMYQQPCMSIVETMAEYQRTLDYINRVPALIKMQNTFLHLERFMPTVIIPPAVSNMSMILPALEYLHTEHPDSYQQVDSILSVEMDEEGSIEQYIQELLSKLKDTVRISDLHQYLLKLAQYLNFISPFIDEPVRTGINQLSSLIIILAYIISHRIPRDKE